MLTWVCMMEQVCDPNIWEEEAEASGVQGQPQLDSKFEASLDYMKESHPHLAPQKRKHKNVSIGLERWLRLRVPNCSSRGPEFSTHQPHDPPASAFVFPMLGLGLKV